MAAAFTLARDFRSQVILLHVVEDIPRETVYSGGRAARVLEEFKGRVEQMNRRLLALASEVSDRSDCDVITVSGIAGDAIRAMATDRHADLIVLGRSARGRVERAIIGSTVKDIVRHATAAVLVVPARDEIAPG